MSIFMRIILPALISALVLGAIWGGNKLEFISDIVFLWLWPSAIAFLFLLFGVIALIKGMKRFLLPLGTGFVVQSVGLILLGTRVFEDAWEPLWYTLVAVGGVIALMLLAWGFNSLRARILEKRLTAGMAGDSGVDLERIRKDMLDALAQLKKAGRGRNAIYELPWYLVMGRPAAGKTVAIKKSGLLRVRKDWVKGVGGTYTADWFFTNELIFLDTPGKWVTEGADEAAQQQWKQLLQLLQKYRGRRPLDGLVVVVPADDLMTKDDGELEEQANHVREVVDLIHKQLGFRFPVYLLVSKADLVDGFVDFFKGLPAQRRHEVLGWSNEDPNDHDVGSLVSTGFRSVQKRLERYRMEMLGRIASRSAARKLFFFTEDFKELEAPLGVFADTFFSEDRYTEAPVFRGFYFTSGVQGEGAPLSKAMGEWAKTFGVSPAATEESGDDETRPYFLKDLFRELMIGDQGLIGRTAGHWFRQRRNTLLVAFAPAVLATLFLVLALTSFFLNRSLYADVRTEGPRITAELEALPDYLEGEQVLSALASTGQLRTYHRKMSGFYPMRRWGLRRPGELREHSADLFRQQFTGAVLKPTLSAAEEFATDPERSCIDRIDILHSVVWLRMGRRAGSQDMAGFDRIWNLPDADADSARRELLKQYGYLKANLDADDEGFKLLPGFSIKGVAESIKKDCGHQGSTSALAIYQKFQQNCRDSQSNSEIRECYAQLNEALRYEQEDYEKFVKHFKALKEDLSELERDEAEAKRGLSLLETIDLADVEASECLTLFAESVLPEIKEYAIQDEMLDECRGQVEQVSSRSEKYKVRNATLAEQVELLSDKESDLEEFMSDYSVRCRKGIDGFTRLEFATLQRATTSYRRVACFEIERSAPLVAAPVKRAPSGTPSKAQPARKSTPSKRKPSTLYIAAASGISGGYSRSRLDEKLQEWQVEIDSAQVGFNDSQRAAEINRIRGEIRSYGARYAGQWMGYLDGMEMLRRKSAIPEWLTELSATSEYGSLLGKVATASGVADSLSAPPFDVMLEPLRPLENMADFVGGGLGEYQKFLGDIASDLERCNEDATFFREFRSGLAANDRDHPLVEAREWVKLHAGVGLANGKLQELLLNPLDQAEAFVQSDNLLKSEWGDLVGLYESELSLNLPFGGDEDSDGVTPENLTAIFGGASGAVHRVRRAAEGATLAASSEAWLKRAEALSAVLFEPDSDELRPMRVRVTLADKVYDPPNFEKKTRIEDVRIYLGEDADFKWKEGDDETKRLDVVLFGEDGSDYSFVRGTLAQKKSKLMSAVPGKNWKAGETIDSAEANGFLAPLRLIKEGLGERSAGKNSELTYILKIPQNKKDATATVTFQLSGEQVAPLLDLLDNGFDGPPINALGS